MLSSLQINNQEQLPVSINEQFGSKEGQQLYQGMWTLEEQQNIEMQPGHVHIM